MKVIVVRHGETIEHKKGILTGQRPGHLTVAGKAHARKLIPTLKRARITLIISSDLKRCKDTAELIRDALRVPVRFDTRLREISSGVFDGKPLDLLRDHMSRSKKTRFAFKPKGGESLREFRSRVRGFIRALRSDKTMTNATVLLITHTAWTREFLRAFGRTFTKRAVIRISL